MTAKFAIIVYQTAVGMMGTGFSDFVSGRCIRSGMLLATSLIHRRLASACCSGRNTLRL
jgi:hypothetical protein